MTTALPATLTLTAAIPLTDAARSSPVIREGKVIVVDGSGVVHAVDAQSKRILWKFETEGGSGNCNNVASPAVIDQFVHVGTMAGFYYVIDLASGELVSKIDCGEPIFASPVVGDGRVYFATLGARVNAVTPRGELIWRWDFVKEVIGFEGNRWSGEDWLAFRGDRVTWRDHFVCSREICLVGKTLVMPAGGRTVFLDDAGDAPRLREVGIIPEYVGSEYPATFGQSADADRQRVRAVASSRQRRASRNLSARRKPCLIAGGRIDRNKRRSRHRNVDRPTWSARFHLGQRAWCQRLSRQA